MSQDIVDQVFDSDSILNVIHFLGLKDSTKSFRLVSKLCHAKHRQAFTTAVNSNEFSANLVEEEGRILCGILDYLRYSVWELGCSTLSPPATKVMRDFNDFHKLRQMKLMDDLQKLNAGVYSYWDKTASSIGVFDALKELLKYNPQIDNWKPAIERDAKYWKDTRIFGEFYLMFDRHDGTVMVSSNFKKVYLVFGMAQTLGEAVIGNNKPGLPSVPKFNECLLGRKISTTLLNWNGKIVYDGLMIHLNVMKKGDVRRALKAYCNAVDSKTIIYTIEKKLNAAAVPSSSSARHGTPTGKASAASIGTPSTTIPAEHSDKVRRIVARIAAATALPGDMSATTWVMRRHGYTEQSNPHHMVTVIGGGMMGPIVPFRHFKKLVPELIEIIELFDAAVTAVGGRKPTFICTDVEYAVEPLKDLLEEATGVKVMYYPPPSAEEEAYVNRTNPYLSPAERGWVNMAETRCAVCAAEYSAADGESPLLRCARCKDEYYCSKAHQKRHWKIHKHLCVPATDA